MNNKMLTPFRWCMLQSFPFIEATFDAIDNYSLLCKIIEYVNKNIEKTNQLGIKVEELNTWFKTLDLQDEVNKKLDEMALSGELTEIIAQYLQLAGLLCFNTINDLKNAENLVDGSFCKTYGKISYNDGYGNFYKIRNIINTDIIDDDNIIALVNYPNLIAEKVVEKSFYVTPEMYGAKGDGITDDTVAVKKCIEDFRNVKIFGFNKTYLISSIIVNNSNYTVYGNFSTLKLKNNQNVNTMIFLDSWNRSINNIKINDLIIDGNSENNNDVNSPLLRIASHNNNLITNFIFNNCEIKNSKGHGVGCYNDNSNSNTFKNVIFENCKVHDCVVGIQQSNVETKIDKCEIYNTVAENITIDNGCNNCKVLNSHLYLYGHGGCIGIDQAKDIIISGNIIDGLNNTASDKQGYANAITFNSRTGICENILVTNNILKNNYNAISIGSPNSLESTPTIIKRSTISNNLIIDNRIGIFIRYSDVNSNALIVNNKYNGNTESNISNIVGNDILLRCYIFDMSLTLQLTPQGNSSILTNNSKYKEGVLYFDAQIKLPSSIASAGWKTVASIGRPCYQQTFNLPLYNTNQTIAGFRDFQITNEGNLLMWNETSDAGKLLLLHFPYIMYN